MPWWRMTPGVKKHQSIAPDETVIHACYGLGANFVGLANIAVDRSAAHGRISGAWTDDFMDNASGLAAAINQSGVLALTNKRVIFFAKRFAIGRPKRILNDWPLEQVEAITYDKAETVLRISFIDGSESGLHVPNSQSPARVVDEFAKLVLRNQSAR